ncbi:MAG: TetR/AcrR family transcriptional regulator C-terminal domain-containing protein [Treponema sp.]|jgi:AcrR family transcriptional regulator|nr:TetR/AcrR family transcriptional regulator C-terminal domain-containing protein [Treponema sp.]
MQKPDTKFLLAQSLLELAKKKPVEKITVTDITNNCSLKREAFYYHFYNKYQLINWFYGKNFVEILNNYIGKEPWGVMTARFLKLLREHSEFYTSALNDQNINNLRECIFRQGVKVMSKFVLGKTGKILLPDDLFFSISFHCYGAIDMIHDWLKNGMKQDEGEVGRLIEESMPQGLKVFFADTG